jgi:hypothetical protein
MMSEMPNYPDFYQPFESQSTPEAKEQEEVSRLFNEIFDDYMLHHMDSVKISSREIAPRANLRLYVKVKGQEYAVGFEDKEIIEDGHTSKYRDSERHSRLLNIQRVEDQLGREVWSYQRGKDGVVRRYDLGDEWAKHQKMRTKATEQYPNSDKKSTGVYALKQIEDSDENVLPNLRLEEDMGINNQPVSLAEMQGLKEFLDSAQVLAK